MHKYLFRVYTQGRNSSQKPSKCVRLQTNNWFISRAWDMRSEQALFIAHAANIQVMSAYPVKYIKKKYIYTEYIFFSFCLVLVCCTRLWLTGEISVVKVHFCSCFQEKSTAFGFWMPIGRGHQLLVFSFYLKAEMFYVARPAAWRTDDSVCPFLTVASGVSAELFQSWPNSCAGHVGQE